MDCNKDSIKYKRVLLKLSGEALAKKDPESGEIREIFDSEIVSEIAASIAHCVSLGVGFGIMIGAGNIWRGKLGHGVNRAKADHMGMLATTINCLRMQDALQKAGLDAVVMTAVTMTDFAEPFNYERAVKYIEDGTPVIFACGIGIPYVSTDTAGVVRALEIGADVILMAKNVDGIYSADPALDPNAVRYKRVSYKTCLDLGLRATDASASAIAMERGIDTLVFPLRGHDSILDAVSGRSVGTLVTAEYAEPQTY